MYRQFHFSSASQNSSFQRTGSTQYGVSAFTEIELNNMSSTTRSYCPIGVYVCSVPRILCSGPKKRPMSVRKSFRIIFNLVIEQRRPFPRFVLPNDQGYSLIFCLFADQPPCCIFFQTDGCGQGRSHKVKSQNCCYALKQICQIWSTTVSLYQRAEALLLQWQPRSLRMNERTTPRSSVPTVASMPMQLSGTERVEHRGLSPPPNFPRTGDSSLQRPPDSSATTTRRHLSARWGSEYFRSLSSLALADSTTSHRRLCHEHER